MAVAAHVAEAVGGVVVAVVVVNTVVVVVVRRDLRSSNCSIWTGIAPTALAEDKDVE